MLQFDIYDFEIEIDKKKYRVSVFIRLINDKKIIGARVNIVLNK